MYYAKVTSKGQTTIPAPYRKKFSLHEGSTVAFKEIENGLLIEPVPDIADSAGSLAKYGDVNEIIADFNKRRNEPFR